MSLNPSVITWAVPPTSHLLGVELDIAGLSTTAGARQPRPKQMTASCDRLHQHRPPLENAQRGSLRQL